MHALLELDCIPAGMELFPAADEDAWTLIKEVIDDCDYYVLILAGKYGSTNSKGVGYTEMEFDYAVSSGKPIISFLHENLEALPSSHTEKSESMQKSLNAFREKAKAKHCKFWTSSEDLGGKVSRGLVQLKKRHPSLGWVPGKHAIGEATLRELEELRAKVAKFELDSLKGNAEPPPGVEDLAQGDDEVLLYLNLRHEENAAAKNTKLSSTWDGLFSYAGPSLWNECTDEEMMNRVKLAYFHTYNEQQQKLNPYAKMVVPYVFEDKVRVQFQALGLIVPGAKKRAVSDNGRYWRLTPYGEKYLLKIKAVRKKGLEL